MKLQHLKYTTYPHMRRRVRCLKSLGFYNEVAKLETDTVHEPRQDLGR